MNIPRNILGRPGCYKRTPDGLAPKARYVEATARELAAQQHMDAYPCKRCNAWHIGHSSLKRKTA